MTDPQFGMYSKNANFEHETVNFEFAIATANRLKPAFVVVTGDLVNDSASAAQAAEYKRIAAKLDPKIRLFNLPGNHDVQNEPTAESLARYRERFGPDYYTFQIGGITGIVLNSNLEKGTKNVPGEAAKMEGWFKAELAKAKAGGAKQIIVFQHIPFFRKDPDEPEVYENIPVDVRQRYLKAMQENGVKWVFAGHQHQNEESRTGDLQVIASGPVGMPLHGAKSGIRVVAVTPEGVKHKYYEFGEIPETLELK
jgi:3',5'-cyclic AMP phosphodiesterase CpdA